MVDLTKSVKYIKGVGPNKADILAKLGIFTLGDLIGYYPRSYEDRNKPKKIAEVVNGEEVLIEGYAITRIQEIATNRRNMKLYKLLIRDETGTCIITWFNQSYLKSIFEIGKKYTFFGKASVQGGRVELASPVFDKEGKSNNTGKIIPVYPLTHNITNNVLRKIIENGITQIDGKLDETLPEYIKKEYGLEEINIATRDIHFPNSFDDFRKARKRLVFEELLSMELALLNLKYINSNNKEGIAFSKSIKMSDVINTLPFNLTKAQLKVLEEIDKDLEKKEPMNRLLQGDVGSGKTIVSIISAYKVVKCGYQAAIMAPTAILASQHLTNFKKILEPFGIRCELLVSKITKKQKQILLDKLKNGDIDILIGTHALLQENVEFKNLGLVVTDEQHRFGVKQRGIISSKGKNPDVLVMTATPIPRTLALILYGDLDISIIDELPPNRQKIDTLVVNDKMEDRVNNFIKEQVKEGRQCYIVCPLIEDNEVINAKSVTELAEHYKNEVFSELKVEYLHGKMKAKEKDEIMENFKDGKIDILISTTVIEVGVDVPNASIMVVQNAERFGLAALHQLRGRVGRGKYKSYCILKCGTLGEYTKQRMQIMSQTQDGFKIAEKDLELRGSGEFFGTKQHGIPEFKIANLFEDMPTLKLVQEQAIKIMQDDPKLEKEENLLLKQLVQDKFKVTM